MTLTVETYERVEVCTVCTANVNGQLVLNTTLNTMNNHDQQVTTQQLAAHAIMNYFLANAEAGNHAANDELIAQLARHQRGQHEYRDHPRATPGP